MALSELTEEEPSAESIPKNSAFHPDNVAAVSLITLLHIKDYLAILAGTANERATDAAEALHERGQFLCPPPLGGVSEPTGE